MSEESLFSEIDDELRRDRLRTLWRRFGPFVIGAAVAVVALVGVSEGWRWWQDTNAARSSDLLYKAFDSIASGDAAAGQTELATVISEGSGDYPLLARFRQAGLLAKDGKRDEAVAEYDSMATAASEQRLRELALVLAAFVLVDSGDVAAVEARVDGITSGAGALRTSALEALGLTQYKSGDYAAAAATFQKIADDPLAPVNQANRVRVYIAQLTAQGSIVPATEAAPAADAAPAN